MKKTFTHILGVFTGLLILLCIQVLAEDVNFQPIGPFGTLNNTDDSVVIPATKAQDLLNVDISPGGLSVKKRSGYSISKTLTYTTSSVHGMHYFYDSNGNDVSIVFHDTIMSASIGGGSIANIFTNGPNGATWQCIDSQGFAYCANTSRSAVIKTNGVTSTNVTGFTSTGSYIAVTPERLVQAGFSASPNDIAFSKANDFNTWTVGSAATDPISFTITAPGAKITCITYAFDRIVWFKNTSFGYILIGNQQNHSDWQIVTVESDLGSIDNTVIFREGILYFRGNDSHLYAYDGSNLKKLTREIQTTIDSSQSRVANSWTQTTSDDFGSGYFDNVVYMDTITTNGAVTFTFPDEFNYFRNGLNSTKAVWTSYCKTLSLCSTNTYSSGGVLYSTTTSGVSGEDQMIRSQNKINNYAQGTTFYMSLTTMTAASNTKFTFGISSYSANVPISGTISSYFYFQFSSTITNTISLSLIKNSNDLTICTGNSCQSGNSSFPSTISIYIATTTYQVSIGTNVIKSGSHSFTNNPVFMYTDYFYGNAGSSTFGMDIFDVKPQTATYQSQVKNAPNLTAWDSFATNTNLGGGNILFYIRSSTNSFGLNSSTPSWTSITSGNTPTISTGTYFQIRGDFRNVVSTTVGPTLLDFTQNWFEGQASDKSYATYFKDAIWWSITAGDGSSTNNKILYYDLINDGFTIYDIAANSFFIRNQALYFGGSTSGYVFKYGDIDNDNGSAINSYWKSKDYMFGSPFTDKEFVNLSIAAQTVSNSSMTITYTINGSSSSAYIIPLSGSTNSSFFKNNRNLPLGKSGQSFNIKFGNNASDQFYEVYGMQVGYRNKSWRPE